MTALKLGAGALGASGVLHFMATALGGFAPGALPLLGFGAVYIALAHALWRTQARRLAWLIFLLMLVLPILAIAQTGPQNPAPNGIIWAIIALDYLCAICMFITLWHNKPE